MAHTLFVPLMLTLGAGLATGIGSTIALFAHRTNKRLLSFSLGLSGGVMIYVSFVELFQQAREAIGAIYGPQTGMGKSPGVKQPVFTMKKEPGRAPTIRLTPSAARGSFSNGVFKKARNSLLVTRPVSKRSSHTDWRSQ